MWIFRWRHTDLGTAFLVAFFWPYHKWPDASGFFRRSAIGIRPYKSTHPGSSFSKCSHCDCLCCASPSQICVFLPLHCSDDRRDEHVRRPIHGNFRIRVRQSTAPADHWYPNLCSLSSIVVSTWHSHCCCMPLKRLFDSRWPLIDSVQDLMSSMNSSYIF